MACSARSSSPTPKYAHHSAAASASPSTAEAASDTVTACPSAPSPMSTTDSPNTTMTSAPCRSTKCDGAMSNRPRTWTTSGDSWSMTSAAAHST